MAKRRKKLFGLTFPEFLLALLAVGILVALYNVPKFFPPAPSAVPAEVTLPPAFSQLSLSARAAYVWDAKTGTELYSLNGFAQLPLASLTKIMTAVAALSLLPEDATVTIDSTFLKSEGDSGLLANEKWRLGDLLRLTLFESSNDGADAIASVAGASSTGQMAGVAESAGSADSGRREFVSVMNRTAKDLGLTETYFLNPTGLDETPAVSGGYGSARDVAALFSYALARHPAVFGVTRSNTQTFNSLGNIAHKVKNTNTVTGKLPSLLASKTGYTDLAGGNLVIAFDAGPDHPLIVSILGSTEKGRFEDAEKLVWATLDYLANQDL